MKRRNFITRVPAVAAGLTVGGAVRLSEASGELGGHEDVSGARTAQGGSGGVKGFVLVEEIDEPVEVLGTDPFGWSKGLRFILSLRRYVVVCPYPVGSRVWVAVGDRDADGQVVGYGARDPAFTHLGSEGVRRVVFPRFMAEEGEDLQERARETYRAARENGLDTERGVDHEWRVVHVEYRCPDGVEHVMCGLPLTWDPRLVLGVMVRGQIA